MITFTLVSSVLLCGPVVQLVISKLTCFILLIELVGASYFNFTLELYTYMLRTIGDALYFIIEGNFITIPVSEVKCNYMF